MKMLVAGAVALAVAVAVAVGAIAYSQQKQTPAPAPAKPAQAQLPVQPQQQAIQSCLTQYTPKPGQSAITMIRAGYEIKAAVPNGLWLQKDQDVYYCYSGRPVETDAQCWQLREVTRC